jgi:hypothetical protein
MAKPLIWAICALLAVTVAAQAPDAAAAAVGASTGRKFAGPSDYPISGEPMSQATLYSTLHDNVSAQRSVLL